MIFQWIKNYISDIKIAWMLVRYKRNNNSSYDRDISRLDIDQHRRDMWNNQRTDFNQNVYAAMNTYNQSFQNVPHSDTFFDTQLFDLVRDDGISSDDEWSNGPNNGYKIIKRVDAGGKVIGVFSRSELFYFVMRNKDEQAYNSLIYLSTDGLSKHDWQVEVIGVDLV